MGLEKTLLDAGAHCVAGLLVLNHKVMGSYMLGVFVASEHGLAFAAPVPVPAVKAATSKPAKAAKAVADVSENLHELEDMLGE